MLLSITWCSLSLTHISKRGKTHHMTLWLCGPIHGDAIGGGSRKWCVWQDVASPVDETERKERRQRWCYNRQFAAHKWSSEVTDHGLKWFIAWADIKSCHTGLLLQPVTSDTAVGICKWEHYHSRRYMWVKEQVCVWHEEINIFEFGPLYPAHVQLHPSSNLFKFRPITTECNTIVNVQTQFTVTYG